MCTTNYNLPYTVSTLDLNMGRSVEQVSIMVEVTSYPSNCTLLIPDNSRMFAEALQNNYLLSISCASN